MLRQGTKQNFKYKKESAELVLLEELPATAPLELLLKDGLGEADVDQPCAQTEEC